jgi:archaellum biogenesis protein FlaJ (TadC family)
MNLYRGATALFAVAFLGIGIALLVITVARGGGLVGYLMGVLFTALGVGRLYLLRMRTPR